MDEQLTKIFEIAAVARTMSTKHATQNALLSNDEVYDVDAQITQLEDYLQEEMEKIGLSVPEAIELATSHVEEENDWDHIEDAGFLQFFG